MHGNFIYEVSSCGFGGYSSDLRIDILHFLKLALLLDRRLWQYIVPVFSFVLIYSKLPHKVHLSTVTCNLVETHNN